MKGSLNDFWNSAEKYASTLPRLQKYKCWQLPESQNIATGLEYKIGNKNFKIGSVMNPVVLEEKNISFNEINALTESVGWGKCFHQTEEKWNRVLSASTHIAYIRESGRLIAFGRILEDGIMCMFYDICVHPDYQAQGFGTLIMNHLINKIKDKEFISIGLFVWEGNETASEFYHKCGFEKVTAMELKDYMKKF